ncbi:MAG TPA: hypothetical protein DCQ64_26140 [Candidatus Rokubacteria bacterium]|nr:hypothetical protein [Candidatus Rokubacteria bacterium]
MILIYLGIDPGLDGALAGLDADGKVWKLCDTPTVTVERARGRRREYDVRLMARTLQGVRDRYQVRLVVLERVLPMPPAGGPGAGRGSVGAFALGRSAGLWEGIIMALGMPLELVVPRRWQAALLGGSRGKEGGRLRALQLFPDAADRLARKKDHGRADALLLAEYGRRQASRA